MNSNVIHLCTRLIYVHTIICALIQHLEIHEFDAKDGTIWYTMIHQALIVVLVCTSIDTYPKPKIIHILGISVDTYKYIVKNQRSYVCQSNQWYVEMTHKYVPDMIHRYRHHR